jgi:hypothetical protein
LLAAAIVGSVGVVILSIAFGRYVIASRHDLPAGVAGDAHSLVAAVPLIAAVGVLHLLVAFATASGGSVSRRLAFATMTIAAVATGLLALLFGAGAPSAITTATQPSATFVAELVVLSAAYASASFLAATADGD